MPSSIKIPVKWTWKCGSDTKRNQKKEETTRSILTLYATKDDDKTYCSCRAESLSNETYNEMSNLLDIIVYCEYLRKSKDVINNASRLPFLYKICRKKKQNMIF